MSCRTMLLIVSLALVLQSGIFGFYLFKDATAAKQVSEAAGAESRERFEVVSKQNLDQFSTVIVLKDRETGAQFLLFNRGGIFKLTKIQGGGE